MKKKGSAFVEIAQMYLKVGFEVKFPDEIDKQKNPDILICCPHSNDSFYIEVSKLGESKERSLLGSNYKKLFNVFEFEGYCLPFSCAQLKYITPEEMPGVLDTIRAAKESAFQNEQVVYQTDDKTRLAIAHPAKYKELENWIETHDYRKGLLGAPLNFDETNRISNYKIRQKVKQIPDEAAGLIYITSNALYFWAWDNEESIRVLQRQMTQYPQLLGIVVFASLGHDIPPDISLFEGNFYGIKKVNEVIIRHLLFVRNKNYQGSLAIETIEKIYLSFE